MGQTLQAIKGRQEDSWYNRRMAPEMRDERISLDELKLLMNLRSLGEGEYIVVVERYGRGAESGMDCGEPTEIKRFSVKRLSGG